MKVWLPPASAVSALGLVHAAAAAVSSLQVKVAGLTVEVKLNDALVLAVGVVGDAVMVVSGVGNGVVTDTAVVRAEVLPTVSRERTA